jgi:RND family efflux transporter MFP subunit
MSRRLPVVVAVFLLAAATVAAGCDRPTAASQPATAAKPKAIHVDTLTVATQPMPSTVLKTTVERGSYVSSGATIAQLDTRMATLVASESLANLETARTNKALAEQDCARFDQLFKKGAITQAEYDRQTASCKTAGTAATAAEQREQQARQTLGDATIRAPFSALVSERYVSVGEYVRPDTKVVHLVDIDPLRLELTIPEQNMGAVKQGQTVQFEVGAFPGQTFSGVVHYIGPAVRSSTRDLVFEAVVSNKQKLLRPGLFATARLDLGKQELPVVPKSALRQEGETMRAFAVVNGHLEERVVQTGIAEGDKVAILNGVKAGDKIVAHPTDQMSDGLDVE